jgi:hypothetical protein
MKSPCYPLDIEYAGKLLTEVTNVKFLGMKIDDHLNWKSHVELILRILCAACLAVKRLSHVVNNDALWFVYSANFHSVIKYGTIFCGNSINIGRVLVLQKRIIRTMVGVASRCLW